MELMGRTYSKRTTVTYHSFTVQAYVTQRLELGKNEVTVYISFPSTQSVGAYRPSA